jgi:Prolipoprotein diacylglyceryl transferase
MTVRETINGRLDRLARPEVRLLGRVRPAFLVCGYTGLAAAVALALTLVGLRGLSPWVFGGIILTSMATFLALAMATKIVTGREMLIYYHHEVAVMAVAAGYLWLLCRPMLPYLDITLLGVGTFLAFGRVGCLMAGCCHGRPHGWGVRYREEHAAAGFTPCFVGVRLFRSSSSNRSGWRASSWSAW